jgi:hypothetical protein
MNAELRPALKVLYQAFRRQGRAPIPHGCPCCTTPLEFEHLASKPLPHLSAEDLERYARKAMTTVDHADTFRYFLPRIVELSVENAFLVDREVVFGKMRYGNWQEWPIHEREALERFAKAIAATFATTQYDKWELDEWVCALGQFVDDVPELLTPLLTRTPAARANLASLIQHNTNEYGAIELVNAFWEDCHNADAIKLWLGRPDVRAAAA